MSPEFMLSLEIKALILDRRRCIYREKCQSMWPGVMDEDGYSRVPWMEVINNGKKGSWDRKSHPCVGIIISSRKAFVYM